MPSDRWEKRYMELKKAIEEYQQRLESLEQRQAVDEMERHGGGAPLVTGAAVAASEWGPFPTAILPSGEPHEHHGKVIAYLPIRVDGDDDRRDIVKVIGWKDGASSGKPYSRGYLLEHRRRLPQPNNGWNDQTNRAHYRVLKDGQVRGVPWPIPSGVGSNPYTMDLTRRVEFGSPVAVKTTLPGTLVFPAIDASGAPNGTALAWLQVQRIHNPLYVTVETVYSWGGKPYLAYAGGAWTGPTHEWFEITADGRLIHDLSRRSWPFVLFQKSFDPAEVFPE